jgi:hypothetical protein
MVLSCTGPMLVVAALTPWHDNSNKRLNGRP